MGRRLAVVVIAMATAAACSDQASLPVSSEAVVVDSAGIRIVTNTAAPVRWTAGEPVTIGQLEGPPEYTFNRVSELIVAPDGHVLVLDAGDQAIKVYGADGTYAYTLGGEGDGPSEFRGAGAMYWRGDTLTVFDWRGPKLARFLGSDFVDTKRTGLTVFEFGFPESWAPVGDGSIVVLGTGCSLPRPEDLRPKWKLMTLDTAATVRDTVALLFKRDQFAIYGETFCTSSGRPGGPKHSLSVRSDGWAAYGDGESYEISVFELPAVPPEGYNGAGMPSPAVLIRRSSEPTPLSADQVDEYKARYTTPQEGQTLDRDRLRSFEAAWDSLGFPTHLPFFDDLLWDDERRLWVGESAANEAETKLWAAYSDDGMLLGEVELPADLTVRAISFGTAWGTVRDDLGVTYVHGYPIG